MGMTEWGRQLIEGFVSSTWRLPIVSTAAQRGKSRYQCFEALGSKYSMQVGSPGGTSLLRAFAQQHCGVIQPSVPTTMLLSRRAGTRELGNRGFLVHALKDLAKARGLSFVEMDHGAADFCTQVYSVAR